MSRFKKTVQKAIEEVFLKYEWAGAVSRHDVDVLSTYFALWKDVKAGLVSSYHVSMQVAREKMKEAKQ